MSRVVAYLCVWFAALSGVSSDDAGGVVIGSFADPLRAAEQREAVGVGLESTVVEVSVDGERYYRVVVFTPAPHDFAKEVSAGRYAGAWFWEGARTASLARPFKGPVTDARAPASQHSVDRFGVASLRRIAGNAAQVSMDGDDAGSEGSSIVMRGPGRQDALAVPRYENAGIEIDGVLNEAIWNEVTPHDNMVVINPDTLEPARHPTEMRFIYTDQGLYIGVINYQPAETLIARLSSRDVHINRDQWGIALDTSGEGLYGYVFNVALGGTLIDGKVAPERSFALEWDGPWEAATHARSDGWSLEVFLPWSMMTLPRVDGDRTMGFWVNRQVAYVSEMWGWPALPFTGARFMSALKPMALPGVTPKKQLVAFPYGSGSYDGGPGVDEADVRAGVDIFWRPTSDLQLTAALYPDFGSVESDDVVVNLTSRETFFPEKRLFFLEGNENFITSPRSQTMRSSGGGSGGARKTARSFTGTPTTLLNTRRIGGAPLIDIPEDITVPGYERSKPTQLLGALKLTGQTGAMRYGVLSALEDDPVLYGQRDGVRTGVKGDGRNFSVARLMYESVDEGRRSFGYLGTLVDHPLRKATTHGVDVHFMNASGKLNVDTQFLMSDIEGSKGFGGWTDIDYTPRRGLMHMFGLEYLDKKIDISDLGFLERSDSIGGRYTLMYMKSSGMKRFRSWQSMSTLTNWVNGDGRNIKTGIFSRNSLTFKNLNEVRGHLYYFPRRWEDLESRGNGSFRTHDRVFWELAFGTDTSQKFSWSVQGGGMQESLSGRTQFMGVGMTYKPTDRFSLDLDANYRQHRGWLLHQGGRQMATFDAGNWQPRLAMDVFLTARQQIRLTMQWAGIVADEQAFYQIPIVPGALIEVDKDVDAAIGDFTMSRLTAQLRYRWEIAPLSDLFVVYTRGSNLDNRVDDEFGNLLTDAFSDPVIDVLVVKLRYRFGN